MVSVVVPLTVTWMTPPYAQLHMDELFSAGTPPTWTVGDPGVHGAGTTGIHVPGVNTPSAAAVWAAVIGFAKLMHTPKGMMFAIGLLSMIVAIGFDSAITRLSGMTISDDGATPNEHLSIAPVATGCPIDAPYADGQGRR